jgi:diguanylate cyclase (GGDEF)-like protein
MESANSLEVAQAYAVRLMQHLVVPTFVLSPQRRVVIWNRACERLTGVAASDVLGSTKHWRAFYEKQRYCLADLVALGRPDLLSDNYPEHTIPDDGLGFSAENWCVMPKLGSQLYLAIDAGPIHDEDGKLIAIVETLRDMTDQKRAEATLKSLAAREWSRAQRSKKPLSLLFADVDHFKLYNDLHGHQKGDECLRAVASVIGENAFRPADLSARYGGEEFAIIMPETDHKGARNLAERLRRALSDLRIAHGAPGVGSLVTLSIGIATKLPSNDVSWDWLLGLADQALYAAKHSGRNRVVSADKILAAFAERAGDRVKGAAVGEISQQFRMR